MNVRTNIAELQRVLDAGAHPQLHRSSRGAKQEWIKTFLQECDYGDLNRDERGVVRTYVQAVTGYSRTQMARYISAFVPKAIHQAIKDEMPRVGRFYGVVSLTALMLLALLVSIPKAPVPASLTFLNTERTVVNTGSGVARSITVYTSTPGTQTEHVLLTMQEVPVAGSRSVVAASDPRELQARVAARREIRQQQLRDTSPIGGRGEQVVEELHGAASLSFFDSISLGYEGQVITVKDGKVVWAYPNFSGTARKPSSGGTGSDSGSQESTRRGGGGSGGGETVTTNVSTTEITQIIDSDEWTDVDGFVYLTDITQNVGIGTEDPDAKLEVVGSMSGTSLSLSALANCNTIDTDEFGNFICGTDEGGVAGSQEVGTSAFSGAVVRLADERYVNVGGDTMTGKLTIDLQGVTTGVGLEVAETISGSVIFANNGLTTSGALVFEGAGSGASLYIGASLQGVGLTDCDIAGTSKLLWDSTTGRFSCGTDTDTNTTYTNGQGMTLNGTVFSVNSTLTGALARFNTVSGTTLYARSLLNASGALAVDGTAYLNSSSPLKLTSAGFYGCTALETDADGDIVCGSDADTDTTYTAGAGLGLTGTTFRLGSTITGSLVRFSTISGSTLYARSLLNASGALAVDGTAYLNSSSPLKLTSAGFYGCTALETDADGDIVCGSDADTDTTYTAGAGIALTGTTFRLGSTITGSLVRFQTISGSTLYASTALRSSGSLVFEGAGSGTSLYIGATFEGAGLGDCDGDNQTLAWDASTKRFVCGDDDAGSEGTTYGAGQGLDLNGSNVFSLKTTITGSLVRFTTVSGSTLYSSTLLNASGALAVDGTAYLNASAPLKLTSAGFFGCTALETDADGDIVCGSDADTDTTYGAGAGLAITGTTFRLGSTITGSLVRFSTISGSTLYANTLLNASGALAVDGTAFLNAASPLKLTNAGFYGCTALETDADGDIVCGSDSDTTYSAGQGLSLAGTTLSLRTTLTGSLIRFTTVSGSTLFASTLLNASGALAVDGTAYLNSSSPLKLTSAGFYGCTALETDADGDIVCGSDDGSPYTAGAGLAITGTTFRLGTTITGSLVNFTTISGSILTARTSLASSGTLVWEAKGSGSTLVVSKALSVGTAHSGSLLMVGRIGSGSNNTTNAMLFSTDQMALGQLNGGAFFGRVGLKENQWGLSDYGNTWTAKDSSRGWYEVAMSSDGKFQTAIASSGQIYISSDYGNTWTAKESSRTWHSVAMSSDGKFQTAVHNSGQIYISSDYGNTWTATDSSRDWIGVAMSSDGKIQTAIVSSGQIYISTDYGNTWTAKESSRGWIGVAMSSDGKIQTAIVSSGQIYISTDYGNTWTAKDSSRSWYGVAMSSDGKIQTATVNGGRIYISSDYGNTWTAKDSNRAWRGVAMSSDGMVQTAPVNTGRIYISSDYGNTWTLKESNRSWMDVAMSSDGKVQTAVVFNGSIYVSHANSYQYGAVGIGTSSVDLAAGLEVLGTVSGSTLFANTSLRSSGSIVWEGTASGNTLVVSRIGSHLIPSADNTWDLGTSSLRWRDLYLSGSTIYMGATGDQGTIKYNTAGNNFSFDTDNNGVGELTFSTAGLEYTGGGTLSGSSLFANTSLRSSGSLVWEGAGSGASLYVASSLQGAGLVDCDISETSKLLWDAATGRFTCGEDQNSGGSGSGLSQEDADDFYVNEQGDTMTGALNIDRTNFGFAHMDGLPALLVQNAGFEPTIVAYSTASSRASIYLQDSLGGTTINDGFALGYYNGDAFMTNYEGGDIVFGDTDTNILTIDTTSNMLTIDGGIAGAGLSDCDDAEGDKLLWDVTTGTFSCGDDGGGVSLWTETGGMLTPATGTNGLVIKGTALEYAGETWTAKDSSRSWQHVAMSADGTIQTAVDNNGQIYVSTDSGDTWTAKDSNRNWTGIAVSADGTIQTATVTGDQIYVSTDSGDTWTPKDSSRSWYGVAMSADGTIQTATDFGGQIYVSTDSGDTWTAKDSSRNWLAVDMSSDGTIQTAGVYGGQIYVSTDSGDTWAPKDSSRNWSAVAISSDGQMQTAVDNDGMGGYLYVSTDFGETWTQKDSNRNWSNIEMSADGTLQVATESDGDIYISRGSNENYDAVTITGDGIEIIGSLSGSTMEGFGLGDCDSVGDTLQWDATTGTFGCGAGGGLWTESGNYLYPATAGMGLIIESSTPAGETWTAMDTTRYWRSIAMSADGTIQLAAVNDAMMGDYLYVSTDSGDTWTAKDSVRKWVGVAVSADGTIQTAVSNSGMMGGDYIYVSTDSGDTWTAKDSARYWKSVAMSADGTIQTAVANDGMMGDYIYVSTDSGETWTAKDSARMWVDVAMSADGTIQTAIANGGMGDYIYVSTDSGDTWTAQDSQRYWQGVAVSADGTIQTAVASYPGMINDQIYVSTDSGDTWTAKDSGRSWRSVAMSADGTVQVAVDNDGMMTGGYLYLSSDSGETWTAKDSQRNWYDVAMSADGLVQTAVVMNGDVYVSYGDHFDAVTINSDGIEVIGSFSGAGLTDCDADGDALQWNVTTGTFLCGSGGFWTQSGGMLYAAMPTNGLAIKGIAATYGETWEAKDSSRNWVSVAMSSDGQYQTALDNDGMSYGYIYTSSDYGETWTPQDSVRAWNGVAMSSDGQYQTAVVYNGQIYVSTDYGDTWTAKDSTRWWFGIAMSADGTIQTAGDYGGYIYVSTDSGDTWTQKDSTRNWFSIAMSSDGSIQTAVTYGDQIFVSTDSGDTWTAQDSARDWTGVAMSEDGQIQTAVAYTDQIFVSTDAGDTWTAKDSSRNWYGVGMNADGTVQIAVEIGGQIYQSIDSGETWTAKLDNRNWRAAALSDDGTYATVVAQTSEIYVSHPEVIDAVTVTQRGNVGIGTGTNLFAKQTIFTDDDFNYAGLIMNTDETSGAQDMFVIISDVDSTDDYAYRITADGSVYSDNVYSSAGADYAEWFMASGTMPVPGEVVCIDVTKPNTVKRCERDGDDNVMGIVSTNPAFIGNSITGAAGIIPPGYVLVGLIGQVPAKAVVEGSGGVIRPGDSVTPGSMPGFVRKAGVGEATVGVALEGLEDGEGVINVLISRRNQSLTVGMVEERVLEQIQTMEIGDEVEIMVAKAMGDLNVDQSVIDEVTRQVNSLNVPSAIEQEVTRQIDLLRAELLLPAAPSSSGSTVTTSIGSGADLVANSLQLTSTLSIDGDARIVGDLHLDGALITNDLFVPGVLAVDGSLTSSSLNVTGDAAVHGALTLDGPVIFGSGASLTFGSGGLTIDQLVVERSLAVLGDITIDGFADFLGDVAIEGELSVARQAGHIVIPMGATGATFVFEPAFKGTPIVTASPNKPVLYAVSIATSTGFTVSLAGPATEDITFSWLALVLEAPRTLSGTVLEGTLTFPVDEHGIPVSSSLQWNACIRGIPLFDATGIPYSCSRYHDGSVWQQPDLGISFVWNDSVTPPYMRLPEGYEATVTENSESIRSAIIDVNGIQEPTTEEGTVETEPLPETSPVEPAPVDPTSVEPETVEPIVVPEETPAPSEEPATVDAVEEIPVEPAPVEIPAASETPQSVESSEPAPVE